MGNDLLFGTVLNEVEANEDANGDGELQATVFLDRSARDASFPAGFDGIRNSAFDGGLGNDSVRGSSNGSAFEGAMGNDSIDLDRARNSSLWGGMDNDQLRVNGASENVSYWGSLGNDNLKAGNGSGNQLDGGLGVDITEGGSGRDQFLLSESAGALTATSDDYTNSTLQSSNYWQSLSDAQKQAVWSSGDERPTLPKSAKSAYSNLRPAKAHLRPVLQTRHLESLVSPNEPLEKTWPKKSANSSNEGGGCRSCVCSPRMGCSSTPTSRRKTCHSRLTRMRPR
jgi:hypothetical protein